LLLAHGLSFSVAHAQGTAFTYQGRLNAGGNPVGNWDKRVETKTDLMVWLSRNDLEREGAPRTSRL